MSENEIARIVVDKCFNVHKRLGPGLLESVYEEILHFELVNEGFSVMRQIGVPVFWKDIKMEIGYRADLIIENKVLIEIKSVDTLNPVHFKQVLTYLRLQELKLGLLVNFNEELIRNGLKRVVNGLAS